MLQTKYPEKNVNSKKVKSSELKSIYQDKETKKGSNEEEIKWKMHHEIKIVI